MNEPAPLMPVAQALTRITAAFEALPAETVSIAEAVGRVSARDLAARVTQPPVAVSAMDGYAVRAADIKTTPATLKQVGESTAGGSVAGAVSQGQCVRIFTGAPVPDGADAIVIPGKCAGPMAPPLSSANRSPLAATFARRGSIF